MKKKVNGVDTQPVSSVSWVKREALRANAYNPNHVAPVELALLKLSIVEDGWTQPIVARTDGEIVDGFHRWLVAEDSEVAGLTGGMVPVVYLSDAVGMDDQIAATIRHNRARGTHGVLRMADIVRDLKDKHAMSDEDVCRRLGMEPEELERLYDASGMTKRGSKDQFGTGWVPDDDSQARA